MRNGEHGYGLVTKLLHWLAVIVLAAQFAVGYVLDPEAAGDAVDARSDALTDRLDAEQDALGDDEEAGEEALERREDRLDDAADRREDRLDDAAFGGGLFDGGIDGWGLPELHVVLGCTVILLALLRLWWRAHTPLPPWSPALGAGARRVEAAVERALLALLLVLPGSGLLLLVSDDLVVLHVAAHLAFFAALAVHVVLVLWHSVGRGERVLSRML